MITALVTGTVQAVDAKTSQGGRRYVLLRLRVPDGDGAHFVGCFVFSESLKAVALALGPGAQVCASGTLKASVHEYHGEHRVQLTMTVDGLLTTHERRSVDRAVAQARQQARDRQMQDRLKTEGMLQGDGLDDGRPLDF